LILVLNLLVVKLKLKKNVKRDKNVKTKKNTRRERSTKSPTMKDPQRNPQREICEER
jgi:hypothetical protein